METAKEYMTSVGFITTGAIALRQLARGIIQFIPVGGQAISAVVAGGGTYAMGKSAKRYFFDDVVEKPDNFLDEGKEIFESRENDEE